MHLISSCNELLIFAANPRLEKPLSASTDVGGIVLRALKSISKFLGLDLLASKRFLF